MGADNTAENQERITLNLAVLCAVRRERGMTAPMTLYEIAEIAGCSHQALEKCEKRALNKLRRLGTQSPLWDFRNGI